MGEKNPLLDPSPVHLGQQLVDGLVGVGMDLGTGPLGPHRVNLVDEDDTRRLQLGCTCQHMGTVVSTRKEYLID